MKQRLLLCLLMLMVSVGIVKAGVDITIAKGDPKQSVTITFTSSAGKFEAPTTAGYGSYPVITDYNKTPYLTVTSNSAVYKIPYSENENGTKVSLTTSSTNTDWGNITITVDGKVSGFKSTDTGATDFTKQVTGITFVNNESELNTIALAANYSETGYFPNLITLVIPENSLGVIPAKTDKMVTYSIGKVNTTNLSLEKVVNKILDYLNGETKNGVL